jgi:regulator of protease activity HflC (stomatin/prohibitin superfamily)
VAVAEAKAKMESAELLAQAEITRAKGVAAANEIIGKSLSNNEAYLRYLWIQNLENTKNNQIIYVPTEAGLPILESTRLMQNPNVKVLHGLNDKSIEPLPKGGPY